MTTRQVFCRLLAHRIPAYGYAVVEKPKPGTFDVDKARDAGRPVRAAVWAVEERGAV